MNKKNRKFYTIIVLLLLIIGFLLFKNNRSTGSEYMPDMGHSKAYETYTKGPLTFWFNKEKFSLSSLLPVANTIPTEGLPSNEMYSKEPSVIYSYRYTQHFSNNDQEKARAGSSIFNPYKPEAEILKRGEAVYTKQCAVCHGKGGNGDGPLIVREDGSEGAYTAVPPAFSDRLPTLKDGEMFHSITYGKGMMGSYASHVKADDRWKLICYIKELAGLNKVQQTVDTTKK